MELQSIIIRKEVLGKWKGSWTRPMSVSTFVQIFNDTKSRYDIIKDQDRVKFIDNTGGLMDYKMGVNLYSTQEKKYLENCLSEALEVNMPVSIA